MSSHSAWQAWLVNETTQEFLSKMQEIEREGLAIITRQGLADCTAEHIALTVAYQNGRISTVRELLEDAIEASKEKRDGSRDVRY